MIFLVAVKLVPLAFAKGVRTLFERLAVVTKYLAKRPNEGSPRPNAFYNYYIYRQVFLVSLHIN